MIELKVGETYKTTDGYDIKVVYKTDVNHKRPFLCVVEATGYTVWLSKDGKDFFDIRVIAPPPKKQVTGYFNIYKDGNLYGPHINSETAELKAIPGERAACVKATVEYHEGQFDA